MVAKRVLISLVVQKWKMSAGNLNRDWSCPHPMTKNDVFLRVEGLSKVFRSGSSDLVLFDNLSFEVGRGEMLAIVGESGAGKSSLLHLLGTLDTPTSGDVYFDNRKLKGMSEEAAAEFRNREIGFVWQFHYLLPEFTALENIAMPLLLRGWSRPKAEAEARTWLREVGLADRGHHRSGELSGVSNSEYRSPGRW